MTDDKVVIAGLDKKELLHRMWNQAKWLYGTEVFDDSDAEYAISKGYIDYFHGVEIKMSLLEDVANALYYNRKAGQGTMQKIVSEMRIAQDISNSMKKTSTSVPTALIDKAVEIAMEKMMGKMETMIATAVATAVAKALAEK